MGLKLLKKGERLELSKGLKHVNVALGWKPNQFAGGDFDPDVSAFMLDEHGKCPLKSDDVIYYNMRRTKVVNGKIQYTTDDDPDGKLMHISGAVMHTGDNRTGEGSENDKETIMVDLTKMPPNYHKIPYVITIYDAKSRNQNFGMMDDCFARVVDADSKAEIARFNITEKFSTETALIVGELYRFEGGWKFGAVGSGYADGLDTIAMQYGIPKDSS